MADHATSGTLPAVTRVLVLAAAALALAVSALPAPAATSSWTVEGISQELMCPTCSGERLDMSTAPAANRVRAYLVRWRQLGWSRQQAKDRLVQIFGPQVLAAPPRKGFGWVAWIVPAAALAAGAVLAVWLVRRWRRGRVDEPGTVALALPDARRAELEQRLDADLGRFD
jgi:cytochrome c-type biogenesis protein CcmH